MMRDSIKTACTVAVFALAAGLCWQSDANAQSWPNEPAGSQVLLDCNFSNALCNGALYDVYGGARTTSLADSPTGHAGAFENKLAGTLQQGGSQTGYFLPGSPREAYVGLWWKMNDTFQGNYNNSNKFFFLNTGNQTGAGLALFSFHGPQNANSFAAAWTTDTAELNEANLHLSNQDGQSHYGLGCSVARNTWYRWEVYVKTSTTISSRDGIVRWWLNGQLCGNYTNANFPGGVVNWELNHTWTPPMDGKTQDWIHWVDHVHISATSGGGGGTKSDTTPPTAPTALRVQ